MSNEQQAQNLRDEIDTTDVDNLPASDPNVAGNRSTDEPVDHEQNIGEPVDDEDPVLDAERAAVENTGPETGPEASAETGTGGGTGGEETQH